MILSFDGVLGLGVVGLDIWFESEGQLADFQNGGPGLFLQSGVAVQMFFLFELEAWVLALESYSGGTRRIYIILTKANT